MSTESPVLGDRMVAVAKLLEGIKKGSNPENDSFATIMINFHEFDNLGFLNNVIALSKASLETNPGYESFLKHLENISRQKGKDTGLDSWHFYGALWIVDNVSRGNIQEQTEYLTGGGFKTKTLDYISRHSDEFPALKDSLIFDKVKMAEFGFRSHRIPHLKKQSAGNKALHELMKKGDIIMMLSPEIDYDLYDVGIIDLSDGQPYLIHLSPQKGEVVSDPYPLSRLFKLDGQFFYGYRWLRPKE